MLSSITLINLNKIIGQTGKVLKFNELESCLSSIDYYDSMLEKVCCIGRAIVFNHPFQDGNKRTANWLVLSYLKMCGKLEKLDKQQEDLVFNFAVDSVVKKYTVQDWVEFYSNL